MTFRDTNLYSRDTHTLEEVYESIHTKETMKQLINGSEANVEGLVARGRSQEKSFGNSDKGKSKSKSRNKSCKYCKKKGLVIDDCYKLHNKNKAIANQKGKQSINSDQVSVVEDNHSDGELLVVSNGDSNSSEEWVLDFGCTFHMFSNKEWFSINEIVSKGIVLMGKDASFKIAVVGTIRIKMYDGTVRMLADVKHAPCVKMNLISLSTLDSKGYKYTGEGRALKVSKSALVLLK